MMLTPAQVAQVPLGCINLVSPHRSAQQRIHNLRFLRTSLHVYASGGSARRVLLVRLRTRKSYHAIAAPSSATSDTRTGIRASVPYF